MNKDSDKNKEQLILELDELRNKCKKLEEDQESKEQLLTAKLSDLEQAQKIASIGNWKYEPELDIISWSDEMYRIHERDTKLGPPDIDEYSKMFDKTQIAVINKAISSAFLDGVSFDVILKLIPVNKKPKWLRVKCQPSTISKSKKGYTLIGTIQDVTVHILAEQNLRKSENRFTSLFENHTSVVLLIDPESGIILDSNKAATAFYGYSHDEFATLNINDINTNNPDDIKKYRLQALKNMNNVFRFEHRLKSGEVRDVVVHSTPIDYKDQEILFSIIFDVSERIKSEQALRESENRFKALHNASFGGITIHDKGVILECNQGLSEITGYRKDELIGMDGLLLIAEESREIVRNKIATSYENYYEAVGVRKNGSKYPLRLEARQIPYKGKNVRVVEFRDITDSKEKEEQIKQDLKEKETLLRELYHRTKNNMAVISAMLSIQSEMTDDSYIRTTFNEINSKIQTMSLVHQKLYKAKDLSNINLGDYVEDLAKLIIQTYRETPVNIELKLELKEVKLSIDSAIPLGLIINELMSNIFKHAFPETQKSEIHIRLYKDENGTINLELSDNGIGFPDDFDPRNDGSMGLASVYSIAEEQLQGEISVDSHAGVKWLISIKDNHYKSECSMCDRIKILIVEDEILLSRYLKIILEKKGYEICGSFVRGEEAIEFVKKQIPDLILMDINLAGHIDGIETVEKIKEIREIPIIYMSGYERSDFAERVNKTNPLAYLTKPVTMSDLKPLIDSIVK